MRVPTIMPYSRHYVNGGHGGSATPSISRPESASDDAVPFSTKTSTARTFEPVAARHCGVSRTSPDGEGMRSGATVAQPKRKEKDRRGGPQEFFMTFKSETGRLNNLKIEVSRI